jgi:hypothetical protein
MMYFKLFISTIMMALGFGARRSVVGASLILTTMAGGSAFASGPRESGVVSHIGTGTRSVPLGGAIFAGLGYDQLVWGDPSEGRVLYGYVRPAIETALAPSLFVVETKISIYPVSFVGLTFGRVEAFRNTSTSLSVDCAELECGGRLRADYATLDLTLGARGWVYLGQGDWRDERPERTRFDFYEDSLVLPGARGGDKALSQVHTFGRQLNLNGLESAFAGINFRRSQLVQSGASSERYGVVVMGTRGPYRVSGIIGLYQSTWRGLQPTVGVSFDWVPRAGLAL